MLKIISFSIFLLISNLPLIESQLIMLALKNGYLSILLMVVLLLAPSRFAKISKNFATFFVLLKNA
jgi:hypothetical protein